MRVCAAGKGNLFVIFGEPDIDMLDADDGSVDPQAPCYGTMNIHPNVLDIHGIMPQ